MRKYLIALFFSLIAGPAWAQCNGLFGANSLCGSAAGGLATEISLSATALTFGQTVTITTPNQSQTQGFNIFQTGQSTTSGSVSGFNWNYIQATNDNVFVTPTSNYSTGLQVDLDVGANSGGSKYGLVGRTIQTATATNPDGDHIGGAFYSLGQAPAGTVGGSNGSLYGISAVAWPQQSGSTGWLITSGAEIDNNNAAGTSVLNRFGMDIVSSAAVHGSVRDAAIELGGAGTDVGFKVGIMLSTLHGDPPLSTTGSIIASDGNAQTIGSGIDLSGFTITTAAFKSSNFTVDGSGNIVDGATIQAITFESSGTTFAGLPVAAAGRFAYITDGKASNCGDTTCTTWGTTVTGGTGALKLLIWYNGANWTLAGK